MTARRRRREGDSSHHQPAQRHQPRVDAPRLAEAVGPPRDPPAGRRHAGRSAARRACAAGQSPADASSRLRASTGLWASGHACERGLVALPRRGAIAARVGGIGAQHLGQVAPARVAGRRRGPGERGVGFVRSCRRAAARARGAGALRPASGRAPPPDDRRRAPARGETRAPPAATSPRLPCRPTLASTSASGAACASCSEPSASATSGSCGKRCCARASGAWICGRSPRSCSSQIESSVDQLAGLGAPRDLRIGAGLRRARRRPARR